MQKTLLFLFLFISYSLSAQTYVKNLGLSKSNDGATSIAASENGFYIAGYSDDICYLLEIDKAGKIIWKKEFDFTEQLDLITHISFDNGKLLGCGFGYFEGSANFLEFYFRFDIEKKEFDWVKRNNQSLKPANIVALPNGNYLVTGDEYARQQFKFFLLELNPNNGKAIRYSSRFFSGRESSSTLAVYKNFIYSGGRYGLEAKIDKYRGAISKFDMNFSEVWSNYYLNKKDKFLRNYLSKIIIDNNELLSLYFTNNNGINSYYTACLAKQNLDGDMLWAAEYTLEGYKNLTVKDVKATADAYYIFGYTKSPTENIFIIKTDKEGNAEWAKTYGGRFNDNLAVDQGNFLEIDNKNIFVIGQSINLSNGTDYNGFLMRLNLDGTTDNKCWEKEVEVKTRLFEELIQGSINLNRKDSIIRNFNVGYKTVSSENQNFEFYCVPKIATADFDTIFEQKAITIDFLKNDIVSVSQALKTKIISTPKYGSAIIKDNKIIYTKQNSDCLLDSFKYEISSEINGSDTATVYIYSQNQENILPNLKDTILPENGFIRLDATLPNATYLWNTLEKTAQIEVSEPGKYSVMVSQNTCLTNKTIEVSENPFSFKDVASNNIIFLLDFSISMNRKDRLPILKKSLFKIMQFMRVEDKLSMVNYASDAEVIFSGINATEIDAVRNKIEAIETEGRSNIKKGLEASFNTSATNFIAGGNNRIIFTTDGDISNEQREELIKYLSKNLPENTYFSIFLFNEATLFQKQMQEVADATNGKLFIVNPKNVEKILLGELKAVRKQ
ncbi:MAG: vWA domain-containing protein [Chitinophagales bacterium]